MFVKVAVAILFVSLSHHRGLAQTICTEADSCDSCLQRSPDCVWCSQIQYNRLARCFLMGNVMDRGNCSDDMLVTASGELTFPSNENFDDDNLVRPQTVQSRLRLGEPQTFSIVVNRVRNAPLDLYFVLDQSTSMRDTLATFQEVIGELFDAIRENITTNFVVGMGLFVDKPIAPFIREEPSRFFDPCGNDCTPTYGFRHIMTLTNNATKFQEVLRNQTISGNLDAPEAGLDAILQAVICEDIIGWRSNSLRMLMHMSDAPIHVAGDGLVAGIVHPPVQECKLQENGSYYFYNGTIIYDYPSISMIRELLSEKSISLVFGVVEGTDELNSGNIASVIEDFADELPQSVVVRLANDSADIIEEVENAYRAITTNITLQENAPDGITVSFVPLCENNDGISCLDVQFDQMVTFNVTMTAGSCISDSVRDGDIFTISVPGFGSVQVNFKGICSCACSAMDETVVNSPLCSNVGTLICGSCVCQSDRDGINCECDENNATTNDCRVGRNNETCSGPERGRCQCDRCVCTNNFFGDVCECDSFSCERDGNNMICGGSDRGTCGCNGTCTCINGWSGSACDCTPMQSNCLDQSALICSNRGTCECNECICDSEDFTGQFCQICTAVECPEEPACLAYGDCVVCQFGTQGSGDRNCNRKCNITTLGEELPPDQSFDRDSFMIDGSTRTLACVTRQGDCTYRYFVGTSTSNQQPPIVFEEESCTEDSEFPAWIIIVIILGALLLLGILVLIGIRIFMELRYRYEYQQWLKEKDSAKFGQQQNPLYTKATTDIDNPLYDKKKRQKQKEAEGESSEM